MSNWIKEGFYALLPGVIGRKIYRISEISEEADQLFGERLARETAGINSADLDFDDGNSDRRRVQKYRDKMSKDPQRFMRAARIKGAIYGTIAELLGYAPLIGYGLSRFSDEGSISLLAAGGLTVLLREAGNGAINVVNEIARRDLEKLRSGNVRD
jgi:hypothetical protein